MRNGNAGRKYRAWAKQGDVGRTPLFDAKGEQVSTTMPFDELQRIRTKVRKDRKRGITTSTSHEIAKRALVAKDVQVDAVRKLQEELAFALREVERLAKATAQEKVISKYALDKINAHMPGKQQIGRDKLRQDALLAHSQAQRRAEEATPSKAPEGIPLQAERAETMP